MIGASPDVRGCPYFLGMMTPPLPCDWHHQISRCGRHSAGRTHSVAARAHPDTRLRLGKRSQQSWTFVRANRSRFCRVGTYSNSVWSRANQWGNCSNVPIMLGEQLHPISFGGSNSERKISNSFGASIAIRQVVSVCPGCIASQMSPEFVRIRMPPGLFKCCYKISIVLSF